MGMHSVPIGLLSTRAIAIFTAAHVRIECVISDNYKGLFKLTHYQRIRQFHAMSLLGSAGNFSRLTTYLGGLELRSGLCHRFKPFKKKVVRL